MFHAGKRSTPVLTRYPDTDRANLPGILTQTYDAYNDDANQLMDEMLLAAVR